jgi:hypothetical protein
MKRTPHPAERQARPRKPNNPTRILSASAREGAIAKPLLRPPLAAPIFVKLIGSDTCTAVGIIARAYAPVCALARLLIAAGHHPATRLEVFRGDVLALRVRSIAEAASLTVEDDRHGRPRLRAWRERMQGCGAAPSARRKPGADACTPSNAADAETAVAKLTSVAPKGEIGAVIRGASQHPQFGSSSRGRVDRGSPR